MTVGSTLRFALEIADTSISGKVVNEAGAPQRAFVDAMSQTESNGATSLHTSTDEARGEFELTGVAPGEYQVSARAPAPGDEPRMLQSPATAVHVGDSESPPPVVLVVKEQTQISGRVTTSEGVPVPGGLIVVFSMDQPATTTRPVRTDMEGHFVARTFPGTRNVLIIVSAPGVGWRFMGRGRRLGHSDHLGQVLQRLFAPIA